MTYATLTTVKQRMKITTNDRDPEITQAILFGDAQCDAAIEAAGGSAPVSSPSRVLIEAASDFAAFYMFRIDNPTTAPLYWQSAQTLIADYIRAKYKAGGAGRSGKRGVHE